MDTIKSEDERKKIKNEYLRRTRKLLGNKLYYENLIKEINTSVVPLIRYSGPLLKWTRKELEQIDQRTRKLMTMHKVLHPSDDIDRLFVSSKERWRGLAIIGDSVDAAIFLPWTQPKNTIPRWYTGRKWHIPMASNRKRSRGLIKAYDMGKVKVPLCHYSDAPEESNLWTAWQLFPLDDD